MSVVALIFQEQSDAEIVSSGFQFSAFHLPNYDGAITRTVQPI
jgi:hypothetical protein